MALSVALALVAHGAAAAQDNKLSLSANVGVATDYVFRGVSQTNEDPQIFAGLDASIGFSGRRMAGRSCGVMAR